MILFRERKLERIMNRMTVRIAKDEVKKKEIQKEKEQKEKEQKEKEQKEKKQKEKEQKEEQERVIKIIGYEKIAEQEESIKQEKAADQIIEMSSSEEPKVGWQDLFAMFLAAGITFLPAIIIFLLVISGVFLVFLP